MAVPQGGRLQPAGEVGPLRLLLRRRRLRLRGMFPNHHSSTAAGSVSLHPLDPSLSSPTMFVFALNSSTNFASFFNLIDPCYPSRAILIYRLYNMEA